MSAQHVQLLCQALTAARDGDFSVRLPALPDFPPAVASLFNEVITLNANLAEELSEIAHVAGREGRVAARASIGAVHGGWAQIIEAYNGLIGDLAQPASEVARVIGAVAEGDLSQKMPLELAGRPIKGEFLRIGNTVNAMVDQLRACAAEVSRVAKEVGIEGKLGGQARVPGAAGTWKDITENVNQLAGNLTNQVRNIALVTTAVANGDLSQQITVDASGEVLALKNTINTMVGQLRSISSEVTRVAKEVGIEGKLGGQARVRGVSGTWKDLTDSVNGLAGNLTSQVRNIALVTTAVANGDLSQKITVDARGEIFELKNTVNVMVDQLRTFAAEVSRVAKEVGTEGLLGGQAEVKGLSGAWKDLTENVNQLAGNLTNQVRNIALVTTAVAYGDLSQKITVDARGEVLQLKNTINTMVDQLRSFAAELSRVAREVGIEGKLGGQASVPGVAGTWKQLKDNVNQLAGNLTTQVRAIAEVSTAVAKGDLTRLVTVAAQGEVLSLKDNINKMIANLRETTQKNQEQDWLKSNLARFSTMMQGQKSVAAVAKLIMSELTPLVSAQHGAFYMVEYDDGQPMLRLTASYARHREAQASECFAFGEGLIGQCAVEKKNIVLGDLPQTYLRVQSGLGEAAPTNVLIMPVLFEGEVMAVVELASFLPFNSIHRIFLDQLLVTIGVVMNIIGASMRTEELLEELQHSNMELEAQAKELEEKATLLQIKNQEVELASLSLEEKAEQLALISKYKSEFLANMSHELRTPLNSLLIMAKLLADNKEENLTPKQIEFAQTIQSSGRDLLSLINEILDLSKVEAGKMVVTPGETSISQVVDYLERDFRPVAQQRGVRFDMNVSTEMPLHLVTDVQRLQQILKNLLSNAFKFTERGHVALHVRLEKRRDHLRNESLRAADDVVAFVVEDTGIGIASSKQQLIFEAFQQVDATTSRKYGGTGLGLTISREITRLLGGEIQLESLPGRGSVFTLYLPVKFAMNETSAPENEVLQIAEPVSDYAVDVPFVGQKILVVDDDVRNIFAITSVLEDYKLRVVFAENGRDAIVILEQQRDIELVLMDVMMPEMDGYETTRAIRARPEFADLPIFALTAKAMKGDREKCLEAGMSEYVAKPVDMARLLSLIRAYLARASAEPAA